MPKKSLTKRIVGKILLPVGKVLFWLLRREPSRTLLTAVTAALLVSAVTALAVVLTNPDALTSGSVLSADNWNRVVNKVLQIGDISTTNGKVCTSNGGKIDCIGDAPTSGGGNYVTGGLYGQCQLADRSHDGGGGWECSSGSFFMPVQPSIAPAMCLDNNCACDTGFSLIRTGEVTSGGSYAAFSCIKN